MSGQLQIKSCTLALIIGLMALYGSFGQQEPQYTQYMYNPSIINPAYVGAALGWNFNGTYRSQWAGVDGAPVTQSFSVSTFAGKNVGLGISVLHDEIGPSNSLNATIDFAYKIPLGRYGDTQLSFGLKGGMNSLNVDFNRLLISDATELGELRNINTIAAQIGVGLFLYDSNWYFGLSTPNLLRTEHYNEVRVAIVREQMHLYGMGGYIFPLGSSLLFKPSFLVKMVEGAPLSTDISANFLWNDRFTIGAAYRIGNSISVLTGFQISPRWMIGYAYDFDRAQFADNATGSQELFLRFQLWGNNRGKISPRFF